MKFLHECVLKRQRYVEAGIRNTENVAGMFRAHWRRMPRISFLIGVTLLGACSASASVVTHDARRYRGKIVAADEEAIYIRDSQSQQVQSVERSSIKEVAHPGKGGRVAGLIVGAGGVAIAGGGLGLMLASGPACNHEYEECAPNPTLFLGKVFIGVGAAVLLTGVIVGGASHDAYASSEERAESKERTHLVPAVSASKHGGAIHISGTF